jgi:hypothetical protein
MNLIWTQMTQIAQILKVVLSFRYTPFFILLNLCHRASSVSIFYFFYPFKSVSSCVICVPFFIFYPFKSVSSCVICVPFFILLNLCHRASSVSIFYFFYPFKSVSSCVICVPFFIFYPFKSVSSCVICVHFLFFLSF